MWGKVFTGFGYWDVYSWLLFFIVAAVFATWFRSLGRQDYKKNTDQDDIFFSGNKVPEFGEGINVPASSAYWGFRKALAPYYDRLVAFHSGYMTDYVGWFVVTTAILIVLVLL